MNNPLELEHVVQSVREILAQLLVLELDEIEADSSIVEDLGADSLDIVDLSFQLGRQYGCALPKVSVLDHTVAVCGDATDYLQQGRLTEAGVELLGLSLSGYAPGQLKAGMLPADVFGATNVRNWARQCHGLFDHLPAACPQCAGAEARINERAQVVCGSCSGRLTPLDGDNVSRLLVERFVAARVPAEA